VSARPHLRTGEVAIVKAVTMFKRVIPILVICLMAAPAAHAQYPGGGGGGGGGGSGGGGGGRGHGGGGKSGGAAPAGGPASKPRPFTEPEIIGVVQAIDPATGRVTIAYEPVEALGWPAGTMPFPVGKTAMLYVATVGQKVRFRLEDQQIADIKPF
jgi:Cu/Ag efflux protein CusF